jgi:hypothetical protein
MVVADEDGEAGTQVKPLTEGLVRQWRVPELSMAPFNLCQST